MCRQQCPLPKTLKQHSDTPLDVDALNSRKPYCPPSNKNACFEARVCQVSNCHGVDAITSGSVTLQGATASGLDFSAVTDYDGVASTLQTALRATSSTDLDNVEVAYDGERFVVTVPLDSSGSPVTVTGGVTGDTADELGLDTDDTAQGSVTSEDDIDLTARLTVTAEDVTVTAS